MTDAGPPRPTMKVDPTELLGLVAMTAAHEHLRPTCAMPKLELANLLHDPAMAAAPRASSIAQLRVSLVVASYLMAIAAACCAPLL